MFLGSVCPGACSVVVSCLSGANRWQSFVRCPFGRFVSSPLSIDESDATSISSRGGAEEGEGEEKKKEAVSSTADEPPENRGFSSPIVRTEEADRLSVHGAPSFFFACFLFFRV